MSQVHNHTSADAIYPFDARSVSMHFVNDHDPLPLLNQLQARYGDGVEIEYLQRDPGAIVIDFIRR